MEETDADAGAVKPSEETAAKAETSMLEEIEIAHKLGAIETGNPASPDDSGPDPVLLPERISLFS